MLFSNVFTLISHFQDKYPSLMGFIYGLLSHFNFNCANYVSRHVSARHSAFQVVYMFSFQMFVYNYLILRARKIPFILKGGTLNNLALRRGLLIVIGCALLFNAYPMLSYSESVVLLNIGPIVSAILAVWILNERYGWDLLVKSCVSLFGILLIAKPAFLFGESENTLFPNRSLGIMMILIFVLLQGYANIVLKQLSSKADASIVAAHLGMSLAISFGFFQLFVGADNLTLHEYFLLTINGVLEASGQFFSGQAFKYGKATTISMMSYARILFAYTTEILIDGIIPDVLSIIGSCLVFSSLFVTIYSESQKKKNILELSKQIQKI